MTISKELEDSLTKCQYCGKLLSDFRWIEYRPEPNWGIKFCNWYCCDSYIKNIEGK